jgi:hypothetical protein
MDWKYKHFHQERIFPAARDVVSEAARAFMGESLGWQVTNKSDGFSAEGYSFTHRAIANVHIDSAAGWSVIREWGINRNRNHGGHRTIGRARWLAGIHVGRRRRLLQHSNSKVA